MMKINFAEKFPSLFQNQMNWGKKLYRDLVIEGGHTAHSMNPQMPEDFDGVPPFDYITKEAVAKKLLDKEFVSKVIDEVFPLDDHEDFINNKLLKKGLGLK